MTRLTKVFVYGVAVVGYTFGFALGHATADEPVQYHIRQACLAAEDSAAHLKLVDYGDGVVRYGCFRKGY